MSGSTDLSYWQSQIFLSLSQVVGLMGCIHHAKKSSFFVKGFWVCGAKQFGPTISRNSKSDVPWMFGFQYLRLLPELKSSQWHGLTDLHDIPANGKNGFSVLEKLASHYAKNKNFLIYSRKKNTVCYYHVTQAFPSESTLYSCLNVKELLARNRRDIQSLNDSKGNKSNHLYHKRTLSFVSSNPVAVT